MEKGGREFVRFDTKKEYIVIMGKIFKYTVGFFHKQGFTQLMPLMLGKSVDPLGPDPGSMVEKIPEIEYQGQILRTVTSMILHKQVALKDFDKIFIMSPNIRLEQSFRRSTGKHLFEFTQADFEIKGAKMDDIFSLVESYYVGLSEFLKREAKREFDSLGIPIFEFKVPFDRITTDKLIEKYGEDWELSASKDYKQPFFAISLKREFYDMEDPEKPGTYLNYDLIYPLGFCEAMSGAEREYEYDRLLMRIKRDKLDVDKYKDYLKLAKGGLSPSAGAGIGMERLTRFLVRADHVGSVQLFKRVPGVNVLI